MWDKFDIVEAHYAFYSDWHGGAGCRMYQRLCRILNVLKFRPAASFRGYESLTENGQDIYNALCNKNGVPTPAALTNSEDEKGDK